MNPTGQIIATARGNGRTIERLSAESATPRSRVRILTRICEIAEMQCGRVLTDKERDDYAEALDGYALKYVGEPMAYCAEMNCPLHGRPFPVPAVARCPHPDCGSNQVRRA